MPEAKANFIEKHIHLKVFCGFWRTISAYDQGKDYLEVVTMFFSGLCNDKIISQLKITNTNIENEYNNSQSMFNLFNYYNIRLCYFVGSHSRLAIC